MPGKGQSRRDAYLGNSQGKNLGSPGAMSSPGQALQQTVCALLSPAGKSSDRSTVQEEKVRWLAHHPQIQKEVDRAGAQTVDITSVAGGKDLADTL